MPPSSMEAGRTATQRLLTQTAQVLTETNTTGKYTTVFLYALACRLVHPANVMPSSAAERAELMADHDLWFDPAVTLPEQVRFNINGVVYQARAGSFEDLGDGITLVAHRCIVVRMQSTAF